MLGDAGGERFCVDYDLALIIVERRLQRFVKTNGFRRDDVHERAALHAGENGGVDLFREFLFTHHDSAARAAQTFVCRRGDKLRVRDRTGMLPASDKPGDVRHVDEQNGAHGIGYLSQAWKINDARIG